MRPPTASPTPRSLGFRMPPEWAPHAATWLAWPHDPLTWPGRVDKVEDAYVHVVRALTPHERVELLVKDAHTHARVQARLVAEAITNVRLHPIPTADSWIRDYGPTFVRNDRGEVALVDWRFNAWGNKYETLLPDDGIPPRIEGATGLRRFDVPVVMEGGSFDVSGAGSLLTTQQCLLNPNRNPGLSRERIEGVLRDHLGVDQVLWLEDGIEGDDTDGHIDDLARFTDERTIAAAVTHDDRDPNYRVLRRNLERLRSFRDPQGRPFRVVELPTPPRITSEEGPLPASYANFYVANGVVLLPAFGHENDERARRVLEGLFPGRRVVPIRCEDVVWGMGTLHCLTQQQPA